MEVINSAEEDVKSLSLSLAEVLLKDWGGPRSPLALQYIKETIIPDLVECFQNNEDLLSNPTFVEIVQWKLKNQFAYSSAVVADQARDLLLPARRLTKRPQIMDPKEPWRRIFRLYMCDESLPTIAERMGYPLDYLDLLWLRLKKLKGFILNNRVSFLECLQNTELREFGAEQLSFLYQFQTSILGEPLYKERLILEQVIWDLGLPVEVSDLVTLLEIVHFHEGKLDQTALISVLGQVAVSYDPVAVLADDKPKDHLFLSVIEGLISLHYIQRNKAGKLTLSEKSAQTMAGFLIPKLGEQLKRAISVKDSEGAKLILLEQNPEVLIQLMDWMINELEPEQAFELLKDIFKKVNKRIDLYLIQIFAQFEPAFELLMNCLKDNDSLIRAKACTALGKLGKQEKQANLGNKDATFRLVQLLRDPAVGVKECAAQALGELGAIAGIKELLRLAEDYGESASVRQSAREALGKLENY